MFSGGSDSTLTASLLSENHTQVHLLTYSHKAMGFDKKCLTSFAFLQQRHGAERFVHQFLDINSLMAELFFKPLPKDLMTWGTYALPMCCGSCKLAMHVRSILYCHEHGIRFAADGSNVELSELFPEQMPSVLELYRQLYARFGIAYSNPVFNVNRSDFKLFDRGVTPKRDYKTEHVVYSNQHSCAAGVMLYGYTLGVSLPLMGSSSKEELAQKYIATKIEHFCIPYLEARLSVCDV